MLYRHFGGIDDLLRATIEAEVDGFERAIPGEVSQLSDFVAALEAFGANLLHVLNLLVLLLVLFHALNLLHVWNLLVHFHVLNLLDLLHV